MKFPWAEADRRYDFLQTIVVDSAGAIEHSPEEVRLAEIGVCAPVRK